MINELGLWISADRGILVWTPVFILLLPALVRSWRILPDWSRLLLLAGLTYTLAQGWFSGFHGGDTFYSYRLGLEFLACAFPAFAMSVPGVGSWGKRMIGPILGLQLGIIGIGAVADYMYLPVSDAWGRNSLLEAIIAEPGIGLIIPLSIAIGALGQKAWNDRFGERCSTEMSPIAAGGGREP